MVSKEKHKNLGERAYPQNRKNKKDLTKRISRAKRKNLTRNHNQGIDTKQQRKKTQGFVQIKGTKTNNPKNSTTPRPAPKITIICKLP